MSTLRNPLLVAAITLVVGSPAAAQSIFVSGGAFANIQRFGRFSSQSPSVQDDDLSGTTRSFAVGVGGIVGGHVAIQLELAAPATLRRSFEPARLLPPLPRPTIMTQRRADYRTRHSAVMVGYVTNAKGVVRAAVLGGVMFFQERQHTVSTLVPAPPTVLPNESTTTSYRMTPVVGFDLPVAVTSHVAAVPQLRMYRSPTSSGILAIWPGASVRWVF